MAPAAGTRIGSSEVLAQIIHTQRVASNEVARDLASQWPEVARDNGFHNLPEGRP
jgi:hypothetical protein